MPRFLLFLGLPALFLASAAAATSPRSAQGDRNDSWDDYGILLTRNIFERNRTAPSAERPPVIQPEPRSSSAPTFVLAGVAVRGDVRVAFFEDSQTGETLQTAVGRTIGGGTVLSISLDSVEYSSDGTTRRIRVGENLAGVAAALSPPPADTTDKGADKSADDVLERMRQRRLNELKQ